MKKIIFGIITGMILCSGLVYAASYLADDVTYKPDDETWNVSNVKDALDELYNGKSSELKIDTLSSNNDGDKTEQKFGKTEITINTEDYTNLFIGSVEATFDGGAYKVGIIVYGDNEVIYQQYGQTNYSLSDISIDITNYSSVKILLQASCYNNYNKSTVANNIVFS